jgi:hypothetical protein
MRHDAVHTHDKVAWVSFRPISDILPSCASSHNQRCGSGTTLSYGCAPTTVFMLTTIIHISSHGNHTLTSPSRFPLLGCNLPIKLYQRTKDKLELQGIVCLTTRVATICLPPKRRPMTNFRPPESALGPWPTSSTPANTVPDGDISGDSPTILGRATAFGMVWKPTHNFVSIAKLHVNGTRPEQRSSL